MDNPNVSCVECRCGRSSLAVISLADHGRQPIAFYGKLIAPSPMNNVEKRDIPVSCKDVTVFKHASANKRRC